MQKKTTPEQTLLKDQVLKDQYLFRPWICLIYVFKVNLLWIFIEKLRRTTQSLKMGYLIAGVIKNTSN
jgi:hypothetical protein